MILVDVCMIFPSMTDDHGLSRKVIPPGQWVMHQSAHCAAQDAVMGNNDDEKAGMWLARFWQGLTGTGITGENVTCPIREGHTGD